MVKKGRNLCFNHSFLYFYVSTKNTPCLTERCLQDLFIPSRQTDRQFAIIVFQKALSRLKLFYSAFMAERERLIGTETGQEL